MEENTQISKGFIGLHCTDGRGLLVVYDDDMTVRRRKTVSFFPSRENRGHSLLWFGWPSPVFTVHVLAWWPWWSSEPAPRASRGCASWPGTSHTGSWSKTSGHPSGFHLWQCPDLQMNWSRRAKKKAEVKTCSFINKPKKCCIIWTTAVGICSIISQFYSPHLAQLILKKKKKRACVNFCILNNKLALILLWQFPVYTVDMSFPWSPLE